MNQLLDKINLYLKDIDKLKVEELKGDLRGPQARKDGNNNWWILGTLAQIDEDIDDFLVKVGYRSYGTDKGLSWEETQKLLK